MLPVLNVYAPLVGWDNQEVVNGFIDKVHAVKDYIFETRPSRESSAARVSKFLARNEHIEDLSTPKTPFDLT
ncbi:hypothetical protein OAH18_01095 [bacterium]|nr:hypothetical protein [bacterium]